MTTTLRIQYLADIPEVLPTLVAWFIAEWEPYYGPGGPGNAEADLRKSTSRDTLPICLVAMDEAGTVAGTITLKSESFSHRALTPWAAAFLVAPGRRKQGIGTALVAALEDEVRRLGFDKLYMATDTAGSIVERRGWRTIDTAESSRGTTTVYAVDL